MNVSEVVKLFVDNGVTIAILAYFCVRDWKFMTTLTEVLATLKTQTAHIVTIVEDHERNVKNNGN